MFKVKLNTGWLYVDLQKPDAELKVTKGQQNLGLSNCSYHYIYSQCLVLSSASAHGS